MFVTRLAGQYRKDDPSENRRAVTKGTQLTEHISTNLDDFAEEYPAEVEEIESPVLEIETTHEEATTVHEDSALEQNEDGLNSFLTTGHLKFPNTQASTTGIRLGQFFTVQNNKFNPTPPRWGIPYTQSTPPEVSEGTNDRNSDTENSYGVSDAGEAERRSTDNARYDVTPAGGVITGLSEGDRTEDSQH